MLLRQSRCIKMSLTGPLIMYGYTMQDDHAPIIKKRSLNAYTVSLFAVTKQYKKILGGVINSDTYTGTDTPLQHNVCSDILRYPCRTSYLASNSVVKNTDDDMLEAIECFRYLTLGGYPYHYDACKDSIRNRARVYTGLSNYMDLAFVIQLAKYYIQKYDDVREFILYYFRLFPELNGDYYAKVVMVKALFIRMRGEADTNDTGNANTNVDIGVDPALIKDIINTLSIAGIHLDYVYYDAINLLLLDRRNSTDNHKKYSKIFGIGLDKGLLVSKNVLEMLKYSYYNIQPDDLHFDVIPAIVDFARIAIELYRTLPTNDSNVIEKFINRMKLNVLAPLNGRVGQRQEQEINEKLANCIRRGFKQDNSEFASKVMSVISNLIKNHPHASCLTLGTKQEYEREFAWIMQHARDNCRLGEDVDKLFKTIITDLMLPIKFSVKYMPDKHNEYLFYELSARNLNGDVYTKWKNAIDDRHKSVKAKIGFIARNKLSAQAQSDDNQTVYHNLHHLADMIAKY